MFFAVMKHLKPTEEVMTTKNVLHMHTVFKFCLVVEKEITLLGFVFSTINNLTLHLPRTFPRRSLVFKRRHGGQIGSQTTTIP